MAEGHREAAAEKAAGGGRQPPAHPLPAAVASMGSHPGRGDTLQSCPPCAETHLIAGSFSLGFFSSILQMLLSPGARAELSTCLSSRAGRGVDLLGRLRRGCWAVGM